MQTLYRKYRPKDFRGVLGQDVIVKVIKKQVEQKNPGHAYLFSGPRGTGKTSMARLLAKAVNCTQVKEGNPCNTCNVCISVNYGKFLDLIEIDAASNRGIDEIRQLRERVNFSPSEGRYKVYIIDEVHMLTKDAFNALLKTLEEPPSHVIFVLATTESHKILPTILSRCQRFNFTLAEDDIIYVKLKNICKQEKVKFSKKALMAIVKNSSGSFRDAESILEKVIGGVGVLKDENIDLEDVEDILGLAGEKEVERFVSSLLKKDVTKSLDTFSAMVKEGVNLVQFIRQSLEYLRVLLIQKVSYRKGKYNLIDILQVITELSESEVRIKESSVAQLPVEVAIVKICSDLLSEDRGQSNTKKRMNKQKKAVQNNLGGKVVHAITDIPKKIKTPFKDKDSEAIVSIEEINKKWNTIVEDMRPFNHHLSAFFKKARPVRLMKGKILLEVPFSFHKQRIESQKARTIFSKLSKKFFGKTLSCICEVAEDRTPIDKTSPATNVNTNKSDLVLEVLGDIIE